MAVCFLYKSGGRSSGGIREILKTALGTVIALTDSAYRPLRGLKVFGKTEQTVTTGKNLLNPEEKSQAVTGTTLYYGLHTEGIQLKANIPYTFSFKASMGSNQMGFRDKTDNAFLTSVNGFITTYTPKEDVFVFISIGFGSNPVPSDFSDAQLEIGSAATAYEPYTGGKPSPSPEYPQELESVGDSVNVTVAGKNLLDCNGLTAQTVNGVVFTPVYENGLLQYIHVNGPASENTTYNCASAIPLKIGNTVNGCPSGGSASSYYLRAIGTDYKDGAMDTGGGSTIGKDKIYNVQIYIVGGYTANNLKFYPMIRSASVTDNTYEPYKEAKHLSVSTPNGLNLPGIPVESGGNYTDSTGKQWICDEVDFEKGVYVQRVKNNNEYNFSVWNAEKCIYVTNVANLGFSQENNITMCNMYQYSGIAVAELPDKAYKKAGHFVYIRDTKYTTANEINTALNGTLVILGELAEENPIPLTADQLAAYAALHSNYPNTTVFNDKNAGMEVKYIAIGG